MAASWLETALGVLRLATAFVVALFLPAILQLLLLFVAGLFFDRLIAFVSRPLYRLFNLVGTPIHEFSHAIAGLLTLNRVVAIKPLLGDPKDAFVLFSPPLHFVGKIAASLAPLFGGTLALWLTARYIIPGFQVPVISPPQLDLESAASFGTVLRVSMDYVGQLLQAAYRDLPSLQWNNWQTYVGLYIALSVGIGIAPSIGDLKVLLAALPLALFFVLALFVWLYLSGNAEATFQALQEGFAPHMLNFLTVVTYAFVLTSLGVLIFLPLRLLQLLLRKLGWFPVS